MSLLHAPQAVFIYFLSHVLVNLFMKDLDSIVFALIRAPIVLLGGGNYSCLMLSRDTLLFLVELERSRAISSTVHLSSNSRCLDWVGTFVFFIQLLARCVTFTQQVTEPNVCSYWRESELLYVFAFLKLEGTPMGL